MLTDAVLLDISQAQRQIDQLEAELRRLSQPVRVPVDIEGEQAIAELRRDVQGADSGFSELNSELAETDRELDRVRTSADRTGRELEQTGRRGVAGFNGMAVAAGAFAAAIAAASGIRAFVGFAGQAISAASDFEESLSKSNIVFGEFSGDIQEFARTGPQALGLANREALAFTATFGNLFVALGLSQQAAAELSPEIVQLGADLASFNNIDVGEALEKLRSGLVGEAEPLRALGVNINEALTSAKAMELGLVGTNGVISEAAKVQARYALILEQTVTAQGDFARTADGVANKQRTLNARFEDLKVAVGEELLPAFDALLDAGPALIALLEGLAPVAGSAAGAFSGLVESIQPLLDQTTKITQGFGVVGDVLTGLATPFRETFEIAASIAAIPFTGLSGFTDQLAETRDTVGSLFDRLQDRSSIVGLANDLEAGISPARAFVDRLKEVADQNDITARTFQALATTAGLGGDSLVEVLRAFRSSTEFATLDAQAIGFVNEELERLLFLQQEFSRRKPGGGRAEAPTIPTNPIELINTINEGIQDTFTTLEGFQDQIDAANFQPIIEGLGESAAAFQNFTDTGDAAREALKDAEGGIVDDFNVFFSNLQTELASRTAFQDNLLLLRAMGLDDLADTFQELGLESAGALADALTDPTAAAEAERFLEEQGTAQAQAFNEAFRTELAALLIQQPVDVILGQIQIPAIQAALNIGPIGGGQGVGDILVQFFGVTPDELPSTAERAVQIINSGVNQSRTGPT